jgi:DNA primase
MPDPYLELRSIPLQAVLTHLGIPTDWKARKNGTEWYGVCPIHEGKNKTCFSFDAAGKFKCFSCNAHGRGSLDLTMAVRKVGFRDAVEILKGLKLDIPAAIPQESVPAKTENDPFKGTYEKYQVASAWLSARGLTPETLRRYEVFQYENPQRRSAYSGSVMLKIRRWSDSECVGYVSRNIGEITAENPKYRFAKGFLKHLELFGCCQMRESFTLPVRVGYIVESPFCVMKFWQLGLPAVSPFGWSLSEQQVEIAKQLAKGWIYLPDRDKEEEVGKSVALLSKHCWVKAPRLPGDIVDPETMTVEQIRGLS